MTAKKKPEERKNEILDVAEQIFAKKGYENSSVEDILTTANLSKGGFYYHYKSKEEVLDAIIQRYTQRAAYNAKQVLALSGINAKKRMEKLLDVIRINSQHSEDILEELHHPENRTMHLKSILESTVTLAPFFGEVGRMGNEDGSFLMQYPDEIMEALFILASVWFDDAFFDFSLEQKQCRAKAFMELAEKATGCETGTLNFF